MLESHIVGIDGNPILFNRRPMMKHPMVDKMGMFLFDKDTAPVFYAAGIPMTN
jgi:hypothetical protein